MPKRTSSYHSGLIDRLRNPQAAASYLRAAMEDSREMFLVALRNVAEARQMSKVAERARISADGAKSRRPLRRRRIR